jgi:hypothetical protein
MLLRSLLRGTQRSPNLAALLLTSERVSASVTGGSLCRETFLCLQVVDHCAHGHRLDAGQGYYSVLARRWAGHEQGCGRKKTVRGIPRAVGKEFLSLVFCETITDARIVLKRLAHDRRRAVVDLRKLISKTLEQSLALAEGPKKNWPMGYRFKSLASVVEIVDLPTPGGPDSQKILLRRETDHSPSH